MIQLILFEFQIQHLLVISQRENFHTVIVLPKHLDLNFYDIDNIRKVFK